MTPSPHSLSLLLAERIDAVCDDFEAAWTQGSSPSLEQYVAAAPEDQRDLTLAALLRVELELRRRAGQPAEAAAYVTRFPEFAAQVCSIFSEQQAVVDTSVALTSQTAAASPMGKCEEAEEPLPTNIGRFAVLGPIGAGAFGIVVRARDPQLEREVAIKFPRRGALNSSELERFLREAKAAANMHHPNICPVYEVGTADGRPYIVMSLVPGKSLAQHLKQAKEPMPIRQAVLTVRKLAQALALAHDKGIVHRDLKPANVMLDRERKDVVIMDFGLARLEHKDDIGLTVSGMVLGTPAYMSPEQARGDQTAIGPATDIYSLGVILHELLTRQRPFEGSMAEVLGKILHVPPPGPAASRPEVGMQLDAIVRKCMAKDPAERFGSMRELAEALTKHLKSRGTEKETPAAETRSDDMFATVAVQAAEAGVSASPERQRGESSGAVASAPGSPRRKIGVLLGFGFAAALILLGIMFFARTPTAEVYFHLKDVDPTDATLSFTLDGKAVPADELIKPRELKVGAHELLVKRDRELLHKYTFKVSLDAGARIELGEEPADERQVAEWLLSIGGQVRVARTGEIPQTLSACVQRPPLGRDDSLPAGPLHVIGFTLPAAASTDENLARFRPAQHVKVAWILGHSITDAGLEELARHQELLSLEVGGESISNPGLASLSSLKKLEDLKLYRTSLSDQGLSHLAGLSNLRTLVLNGTPRTLTGTGFSKLRGLDRLQSVTMNGSWLSDQGLARVAELPALSDLTLVPAPQITDAGLAELAKAKRLDAIVGDFAQAGDEGLLALCGLKSLTRLILTAPQVSDEGLAAIGNLKGLQRLQLKLKRLTDSGVQHLETLLALEDLSLQSPLLTDAALEPIAKLWRLKKLSLQGTAMNGQGLTNLAALPQLEELQIIDCPLDDEGLAKLNPKVRRLSLVGTKISDRGLEKLHSLSALQQIHIDRSLVSPAGLAALGKALPDAKITVPDGVASSDRSIAEWVLVGGGTVRIAAEQEVPQTLPFPPQFIAQVSELPSSPFKVFEVVLTAEQSTDENLDRLAGLTHLRSLLAPGHGISDLGIAKIARHRGLLNLELRGNRISSSATKELGRLADLQELFLFDTSLDDNALRDLVGLKRLTKLHVVRCAVTGTGATHLAQLPSLRRLSVGGPALSDEGLEALAQLDKLEFFGVDRGDNITDAGLAHVGKMKNLRELFFGGEKAGDEGVAQLANLKQLEVLNLRMPRMTRAGVRALESLESVLDLALSGPGVNDDGLESLGKLWRLKLLSLQDTGVKGNGLAHLEKLSQLEGLTIRDTPLSDEGLENLKAIPSLANLVLAHTGLTDRGLEKLKILQSVRHVHLEASPITAAGVEILRKALPKAEVVWRDRPAESETDRAVAEWVLSNGGNVKVVVGEIPQSFDDIVNVPLLTEIRQLPADPFHVIGVQLHRHQGTDATIGRLNGLANLRFALLPGEGVTDEGVKTLAQHKHLRVLQLDSPNITANVSGEFARLTKLEELLVDNSQLTDDSLREFASLKHLRVLSLENTQVSGVGAVHLEALPIKRLYIVGPAVTDDGLQAIGRLRGLNTLFLDRAAKVSNESIAHLKELEALTTLSLGAPNLTDAGVAQLKQCSGLHELHLFVPNMTDDGLAHLAQLKNLRRLTLSTPLATAKGLEHLRALNLEELSVQAIATGDDSLEHVARMKKLQRLSLLNTSVTGKHFDQLQAMSELQSLRIVDSPIDDAGLAVFKSPRQLIHLYLIRTKVTDDGLIHLHQFRNLRAIELDGSPVTAAGVAALRKALPECSISPAPDPTMALLSRLEAMGAKLTRDENAPGTPVVVVDFYAAKQKADDALLVEMQHLPSLRRLVLWGCEDITDDGLVALQKLPNLRELDVGVTKISDKGAAQLRPLTELESLNLSYTQVTSDGLAHLAGMKKLKSFALDSVPIGDDGLQHIAGFTELTYLNLLNTRIEGSGLRHLAQMKKLKQLWLAQTAVNDDSLPHLEAHKELRQLFLDETLVTRDGVDRLQKALPECKITFGNPARAAAEFLVANGAGIAGRTRDGQTLDNPKSVEQLPKNPFEIHYLEASKCPALTDEVLAKHAAGLTQVTTINGNDTRFTGTGFAEWKQSKLTSLDLYHGSINDAGLRTICQIESIDFLSLEKNLAITDAGLVDLPKLRRLHLLGLNGTNITNDGLAIIAKSPSPRLLLHVANTSVGDDGLRHLAGSKLASLNVHGTKITSAGLAHLKNLNLEDIVASRTAVGDDGLQYFSEMTNFRRAYFNDTKIAGPGLAHFRTLRLDELKLANTPVDDDAIPHLLEIKSLKSLDLTGTKVSAEGLKRVKEGLPECKVMP